MRRLRNVHVPRDKKSASIEALCNTRFREYGDKHCYSIGNQP